MITQMCADETAPTTGPALTNAVLACAEPGRLFSVTVFNTKGMDQYIQVHDAIAAPADGAVPRLQIKVPADYHGSIDFWGGRIFGTGIYVCNSTTSGTKTLGAADCLITVEFKRRAI